MDKNSNLKSISIKVASPDDILGWSHGEVIKAETLNYRTQRPEKDGLFSERIFGPTKDYECYCGKYKKIRYKGTVCEKCGVEVTRSVVRRERMGHITLATPVTHIWFLKTAPSKLSLLLDISVPKLERIVYYASYVVTDVNEESRLKALKNIKKEIKSFKGSAEKAKDLNEAQEKVAASLSSLKQGLMLTEQEYYDLASRFGDVFEADRGAGALRKILEKLDLKKKAREFSKELEKVKDANRHKRLLRSLKLVKSLVRAKIRPEWMVLTILPVLPPELRPMVALDGGRYATADLNDLYRRVINRNNRLKKLINLKSPEVIITNEKRMLQEAVDALLDNSARLGSQFLSARRRPLRSLADMLKGKQGRFRQNLLGKRVDYSGRSVIVVGPDLKIDECGLPKNLALEIFRPFVIHKIIKQGLAYNIKNADRFIDEASPEVWAILEGVIANKMVLLNRAPTLHRLGIQAFKPLLIEDLAIRIPALVCTAFNADFDGDQMAVHLPLTKEAQYEVKELMSASKNLLKPANGEPIVTPTQDMVLGCYFLTHIQEDKKEQIRVFSDFKEVSLAHDKGLIDFNTLIKVFRPRSKKLIETSYGRLIFNEVLPKDFEFVNEVLNKKALSLLVAQLIEKYGIGVAHKYIDRIKSVGFSYATISAITWGMSDTIVPKQKKKLIKDAEKEIVLIESQFNEGLLSNGERRTKFIEVWNRVREKMSVFVKGTLTYDNPIYKIIDSGARGTWAQPNQMMGMKGLVSNPRGETIELPVKSSFKEGFKVLEYFISTHGARKGSTDTALKTASAGYLTRRLVDVAQDLVIRDKNCKTREGLNIIKQEGDEYGYPFADRLYSRVALDDIIINRKVVVKAGEIIYRKIAEKIQAAKKIDMIKVRSPIHCKTFHGICATCYGLDLSKNKPIELGEVVGVVAAQSIGEPGTQLTMRTFHVGGIAGFDITHGLPRVEEIFEARPPKGKAPMSKEEGTVLEIEDKGSFKIVKITPTKSAPKVKSKGKKKKSVTEYIIPLRANLYVKKGDKVVRGQALSEGSLDLKELLAYRSAEVVERYIVNEVQKIYFAEGAAINDKHIEVIIRQMLSRFYIKNPGDTDFMEGDLVDKSTLLKMNREVKRLKGEPAKSTQQLLGISRISITTESFLSGASFQETARVLVNAAVEGKNDILRGLKENVIIGKLIPAGTGLRKIDPSKLQ